jgi:hypothetical protein
VHDARRYIGKILPQGHPGPATKAISATGDLPKKSLIAPSIRSCHARFIGDCWHRDRLRSTDVVQPPHSSALFIAAR